MHDAAARKPTIHELRRDLAGNAHKHFAELKALLDQDEPDYAN